MRIHTILASTLPSSTSKLRQTFKVLAWLPVIIFLTEHCCSLATISGRSMQPTFNPDESKLVKDIVILNRYAGVQSAAGQPTWKVGDVVALKSPLNPSKLLIKRIIGLQGSILKTLYPHHGGNFVRIPRGHCWIEGDDTFHSRDSNTFGPVPLGLLDSRVGFIIWPPARFGPVQHSREYGNERVQKGELGNKKVKFGGGGSAAYGSAGDQGFSDRS